MSTAEHHPLVVHDIEGVVRLFPLSAGSIRGGYLLIPARRVCPLLQQGQVLAEAFGAILLRFEPLHGVCKAALRCLGALRGIGEQGRGIA